MIGLVNGVAIGSPLLVGVAAGHPSIGAFGCLGAYVAAFTNKGGPRRTRTIGLAIAALVNAVAFFAGELATGLFFPLALVVLAVLVWVATMGDAVSSTAARLGTMPATALLAGTAQAGSGLNVLHPAGLVLLGGVWYAAATWVLTPTPRVRDVLVAVAEPYREVGRYLALIAAAGPSGNIDHVHVVAALRRAEGAVAMLRIPGGDEHLADVVDPLLTHLSAVADLAAALARTGAAPPAVASPVTVAVLAEARGLADVADLLSHRSVGRVRGSGDRDATADLAAACDRMRAGAAEGDQRYSLLARAGRQRRLLAQMHTEVESAHRAAESARGVGAAVISPPESPRVSFDVTALRKAARSGSSKFRNALRTTVVATTVSGKK